MGKRKSSYHSTLQTVLLCKHVLTSDGSIHIIPDEDENSINSSDEESFDEADSDDQVDDFEEISEDDGYFED